MAKFNVVSYAIVEYVIEADSPEEANTLAWESPIELDLVQKADCDSRIKGYSWHWSDAMGSEVYDEEGESVLCDW